MSMSNKRERKTTLPTKMKGGYFPRRSVMQCGENCKDRRLRFCVVKTMHKLEKTALLTGKMKYNISILRLCKTVE